MPSSARQSPRTWYAKTAFWRKSALEAPPVRSMERLRLTGNASTAALWLCSTASVRTTCAIHVMISTSKRITHHCKTAMASIVLLESLTHLPAVTPRRAACFLSAAVSAALKRCISCSKEMSIKWYVQRMCPRPGSKTNQLFQSAHKSPDLTSSSILKTISTNYNRKKAGKPSSLNKLPLFIELQKP